MFHFQHDLFNIWGYDRTTIQSFICVIINNNLTSFFLNLTRSNGDCCLTAPRAEQFLLKFSSLLAFTKAKMMKSVWCGCSIETLQISCEPAGKSNIDKYLVFWSMLWNLMAKTSHLFSVKLHHSVRHWSQRLQLDLLPSWFPCVLPADTWGAETYRRESASPLSERQQRQQPESSCDSRLFLTYFCIFFGQTIVKLENL